MSYLDGEEQAKHILRNGFANGSPKSFEISLLAKLLKEDGFGREKLRRKLIDTCKELHPDFNEIMYFSELNEAVRIALQREFVKISPVHIYQEEIDEIRRMKDFKGQKILFSFLVSAKMLPQWGYDTFPALDYRVKEVLSRSKTNVSYHEFSEMYFNNFVELGLIEYKPNHYAGEMKAKYKLLFSRLDGSLVHTLQREEDIRNCSKIYKENIIGGELAWCKDCDEEFIKVSNRKKRCVKCQRIVDNKKKLEYFHKNKTLSFPLEE